MQRHVLQWYLYGISSERGTRGSGAGQESWRPNPKGAIPEVPLLLACSVRFSRMT